jgi:uncharacterized protein
VPPSPRRSRTASFSLSRPSGRGPGGGRVGLDILVVFLFLALPALAALTFPPLTGRVVDQANLLPAADRAALTDALAALEAKTTDQLVIVTLKDLQGASIEDFGYQLGRHWGIGRKGKDNGALLIVVPSERRVRIEVGYGLEGTLTDAATRIVIEGAILPRFRAGDFPGGIRAGAARIIELLTGEPAAIGGAGATAPIPAPEQDAEAWPVILIVLAAVGFLIACAVFGGGFCRFVLQMLFWAAISGRGRSGGGGSGGGTSFSGGGGSFGGGGSSGRW